MVEHTYPPDYKPGTHWAITEAWRILDQVKPGVLSDDVRMFLAGAIAGTLVRLRASTEVCPDCGGSPLDDTGPHEPFCPRYIEKT